MEVRQTCSSVLVCAANAASSPFMDLRVYSSRQMLCGNAATPSCCRRRRGVSSLQEGCGAAASSGQPRLEFARLGSRGYLKPLTKPSASLQWWSP